MEEKSKTEQSIEIIESIQETLGDNESVLTTDEIRIVENSLTNIKVSFAKIKTLENDAFSEIAKIQEILSKAKERL